MALKRVDLPTFGRPTIPALSMGITHDRSADSVRYKEGLATVTAASNLAASAGNSAVGPRQRRSSIESNSGMSSRSVARSRKRNARSRSRASVRARLAGLAAFTPHVRQSAGMDSSRRYFASTAAEDFAPQPGTPRSPSALSPTSARQSGIDEGSTPHLA